MSEHPEWCDPLSCNVSGKIGAHRSKPITVDQIQINIYADATTPDVPLVEIRCEAMLLQPRTAYGIGRMLVTLGKRANSGGGSAP